MMTTDHTWPTGAVTFLFTDIEHSTPLWDRHRSAMRPALAEHDALLKAAVESNAGVLVKTTGDGLMAAFISPSSALGAALDAQKALQEATWSALAPDRIRVRMGLHTGEAELRAGDYYGTAVNRAARLMSVGHGGQVLVSGTTARIIEGNLPDDVGLADLGEYRLRGLSRPTQVLQVVAPFLHRDFPPLRTGQATKDNLPPPLTDFVGRELELRQLDELISTPETRLVTVLGPGGMGKTQLSIEWARRNTGQDGKVDYADGIHFVDLAPLEVPDQVAPAMADVFAFPLQGERRSPEQQMLDYLREKNTLLIFDNFEHITAASAFVQEILDTAPTVQILVTSRERLHLKAEQIYPVEGLACPPASLRSETDLEAYAAVQLLIRSAQRVRPDFELTGKDRGPVSRICRVAAGMPLAIELAAAWLDVMPIATIADEIERRLDVLESDLRDVPVRHRSIRAAIDTTWNYLQPYQQETFACLSIFRGGFTWEAATAVLGDAGDDMALRRTLLNLRDKSLLGFEIKAERFTIHQLLRHYGAERLQEADRPAELTAVRDRHAMYYARSLADNASGLKGPQFADSLRLIESDLENLLVAWEWLIENERRSELAATMDGLGLFLEMLGYHSIGRRNFRSVADRWRQRLANSSTGAGKLPGDLRFLARVVAWLSVFELDRREAASLLQESLTLLDIFQIGEEPGEAERAFATYRLGLLLRDSQIGSAIDYFKQGMTIFQELDDSWGVAKCLIGLGYASGSVNLEAGRDYVLQASDVFASIDDVRGLGQALSLLVVLYSLEGDDVSMETTFRRLLAVVAPLEESFFLEDTLFAKFFVSTARGDYQQDVVYREQLVSYNEDLGRARLMSKVHLAYSYLHADQFNRGRALLLHVRQDLQEAAIEDDYRLAFCFHILASLALAEDEFKKAQRHLQNALAIYEIGHTYPDIAGVHTLTGIALVGQDDLDSAQSHIIEGLRMTLDLKGIILLGESLLAIALLMAHRGETYQARKLYELVWRMPRFQRSALYDAIAGKKIRSLTSTLSPEDLNTLVHEAVHRDPWQEATTLFEEMQAASAGS
ncbi:MAG: hypothetical protein JSW55_19925 [Chloroflexota bacterium]|nr:MAG: hypothetical protein JSW55_19925 [Chloroflexota bacterium]